MKREAGFGSDFTTNPEGIPTKDPRRVMRNNQRKGVWSHVTDVNAILSFIAQENDDMEREAFSAGVSVDENSVFSIANARFDEAVGNCTAHDQDEHDLTKVKGEIFSVSKLIKDYNVLPLNPFVDKKYFNKSLKQLRSSLEILNTKGRRLRRALNKTNSKFPLQFQEYPHIPLADKDE